MGAVAASDGTVDKKPPRKIKRKNTDAAASDPSTGLGKFFNKAAATSSTRPAESATAAVAEPAGTGDDEMTPGIEILSMIGCNSESTTPEKVKEEPSAEADTSGNSGVAQPAETTAEEHVAVAAADDDDAEDVS